MPNLNVTQNLRRLLNLHSQIRQLDSQFFFRRRGILGTLDFRIDYFRFSDHKLKRISPWHHIPLFPQFVHPHELSKITEEINGEQGEEEEEEILCDGRDQIIDQIDSSSIQLLEQLTSNSNRLENLSSSSISNSILELLSDPSLVVNMLVEIPKFTNHKMELSTGRECNPLIQDSKDGKPRICVGPMYWNYGSLPQTWENPDIRGRYLSTIENA